MITAFTGALYGYLGRYEDAIREAHKSFEIQKDCPDGYYVLGETYLAMGKKDQAIAAHKNLAEVDPVWKWWYGYNNGTNIQYSNTNTSIYGDSEL